MMIGPVVIGCVVLLAVGRALALGSASASGDAITRDDEPLFYWLCIAVGVGVTAFLFYVGLRG